MLRCAVLLPIARRPGRSLAQESWEARRRLGRPGDSNQCGKEHPAIASTVRFARVAAKQLSRAGGKTTAALEGDARHARSGPIRACQIQRNLVSARARETRIWART